MFGNKKIFVLGGFAPHDLLAKTGFARESPPLIRSAISRCEGFEVHGERVVHASMPIRTAWRASPRSGLNQFQMPSLDLSRSLTACGLALPPDDFITWPTNQPTS